jgi:Ca2+-binding RTX toxin-like protein
MQLISDEGDDSIFGGDGDDEVLIGSAGEDVLYFVDDCNSFYGDGYGQRDKLYCGGGQN